MKKIIVLEEIKYYEGVLQSIENMLRPTVVLRRILNSPNEKINRIPQRLVEVFDYPQLFASGWQ